MIRIGLVGIGFMGMIHYLAARQLQGARVDAICSRDPKKLAGDWRGLQGNFGPPGEMMDLSGVKKHDRLEALLADPDIDLIDICNPTALHPETAMQALRAGKHVLVEKAIAINPADADAMLRTAAQANRLLMVAHVLPFVPEFAYAAEAIRGGRYGEVLGAHFKRIISRPLWSTEISDPAMTGGMATDLHIHDTHFISLVCGVPRQVFATGFTEQGDVRYLATSYLYEPGGPAVTCASGALAQKGRPFVHGFEIYLEGATLLFESGAVPLTVFHADGKVEQPAMPGGGDPTGAFTLELQAAVNGVIAGKEPDLLSGKLARDALVLVEKECESLGGRRPVAVTE
jgi:predicted dehydrogenase